MSCHSFSELRAGELFTTIGVRGLRASRMPVERANHERRHRAWHPVPWRVRAIPGALGTARRF
jgi:hypothetical protein